VFRRCSSGCSLDVPPTPSCRPGKVR
jgi:hypothetical protein